jgi:hypothetical protein
MLNSLFFYSAALVYLLEGKDGAKYTLYAIFRQFFALLGAKYCPQILNQVQPILLRRKSTVNLPIVEVNFRHKLRSVTIPPCPRRFSACN